ncbi:MAG: type VI-B CRISPR-associated RNA-guided ribonuclease Cas13b [Planctomycetaceae bacterium]|nr:type VI-B CRISPR-associated RNA-guided ribonuclease Cas13b [Planctomycetaceae bacterium]
MSLNAIFDKPFWAMQFGMATNNLLTIVQFLEKKYANDITETENNETIDIGFVDSGFSRIEKSPIVKTLKQDIKTADIRLQSKILDDILKRLPFLREIKNHRETARKDKKNNKNVPSNQIAPAEIADLLLYYAELLYDKRNFYAHAVHEGKNLNFDNPEMKNLYDLSRLIEINRRTVKERFYKGKMDDRRSEIELLPLTPKIVQRQKSAENPQYLFGFGFFNKTKTDFSPLGLAFFVSQFLEPKYISQLVQGLREIPINKKQLIIRAFSCLHISLPRTRLETNEPLTPQMLGLDIFNELHKCPDELFKMFSTAIQEDFRSSDEINLSKRFDGNRFINLALAYFDLQEKFVDLRFAIDKGTFFIADYGKTNMIDGVPIEHRRLSKQVYCFQRIQDAVNDYKTDREKPDTLYWKPAAGLKPDMTYYRVDVLPCYAFGANNIGLSLTEKKEATFDKKDEKQRIRFQNPEPDVWLSVYELPALLFLASQGKAATVEQRLKEFHGNWNKFRQAIAAGQKISESDVKNFGLNFANLPDELKVFINTGKTKPNTKFAAQSKEILQKIIDDTQHKLNNFKKEQEVIYKQGGFKQGKKSKQPRFKPGTMASFLARDVIKLQKPTAQEVGKHNGKVTSANFQALQRSLAFFDYRKDSLRQIFVLAGLTKNPAFIENLLKNNLVSFERFFENYLIGKINFLKGYLDKPEDCYVLRRRFARNTKKGEVGYIVKWADMVKKHPINLPRGFFTDLVLDVLREKFPNKIDELPKRVNQTFLIQKFHEWNGDGFQWFYTEKRSAESETFKRLTSFLAPEKMRRRNDIGIKPQDQEKLYRQWTDSPTLSTLYSIEKEYLALTANNPNYKERFLGIVKFFDSRESGLRHTRLQDIALFYAMLELLGMQNVQGVKLQNIKRKMFLLNEATQKLSWSLRLPSRPSSPEEIKNKIALPNDWEVVITGEMKLKNYGNFHRLFNDARLPSLLHNLNRISGNSTTVPLVVRYENVETEFSDYDRLCKGVFEVVHELEKKVIAKYDPQPKIEHGQKFIDFSAVVEKLKVGKAEKSILFIYRNAFVNQEYPEFVYWGNDKDEDEKLIEACKKRFKEEQNRITSLKTNQTLTKCIIERAREVFNRAINTVH